MKTLNTCVPDKSTRKAAACPKSSSQSRHSDYGLWLLARRVWRCKCKTLKALEWAGLSHTPALLSLPSHRQQIGCMFTLCRTFVPPMVGTDIAGVDQTQTRAAPGIRVPGGQPGYPAGTVCRGCMCSARPASDGLTSLTSPITTAHVLLG